MLQFRVLRRPLRLKGRTALQGREPARTATKGRLHLREATSAAQVWQSGACGTACNLS